MLEKIKFNIEIQNDGHPVFKREAFEHSFAKGLTAITGPNGTGKSMVTEMAIYALFGSKALRGKAEDYKKLEVELSATIGGKAVHIVRSKGIATLSVDGVASATGTAPVNQAVADLFGYTLDVFNVANVAKQGEIEKLGSMKPAERKRLVDEVVGINILEGLEAYITGELKSAKAVATALGDPAAPPTEPVLESAFDRETIETVLETARTKDREKHAIITAANQPLGERPKEPIAPSELRQTLEELQAIENQRNEKIGHLNALKADVAALGLNGGPRPEKPVAPEFLASEAEITANNLERVALIGQLQSKQQELRTLESRRPTKPVIPDVEVAVAEIAAYAENVEKIALRDQLRERKVPHDCPKCNHHWEDADPRLADLEALAVLPTPQFTNQDIINHQRAVEIDEQRAAIDLEINVLGARINEIGDTAEKLAAITNYRNKVDVYGKYALLDDLEAKIATIVIPESVAVSIEAWHLYNRMHSAWKERDASWLEQQARIEAAKTELAKPEWQVDFAKQAEDYSRERDLHIAHEAAMVTYKRDLEAVTKANKRIADNMVEIDQWTRCREAVRILRAKVKGFLLPSLNRASSHLIGEMTGGAFSRIEVTDEFDITVDEQRLETLSGGGKAVANLALRLALGQVLTNRIFPVVMLDEIDASCDDERAASMAAAVRSLSEKSIISQIILISHKPSIEADHFIRMEEICAMEAAA